MKKPDTTYFSETIGAIASAVIYSHKNKIDFGFDAVVGKGGGFPDIREVANCLF